ncbi:hypothetical protein [Actinoplanes sp. NBRC 101535]|uniref:hypothetical protein n=1 Tax=Actinoplanes sp. NBRC 101535 TaxID=3032196 RepID=UPI0024A31205|nr:hypothetical protein [Actinoplanes sp. NBRC 101535]GLY04163.1 hypothetical protein Acsp01_45420 [Actinoplanes sp. NBRC 101535]
MIRSAGEQGGAPAVVMVNVVSLVRGSYPNLERQTPLRTPHDNLFLVRGKALLRTAAQRRFASARG